MKITDEELAELLKSTEHELLDFKEHDYAWDASEADKQIAKAARLASNAELAKDLMAMSNSISSTGERGYILIGVTDDGEFLGMKTKPLDDASLHQKVDVLLKRVPKFTFGVRTFNGKKLGVIEISQGIRPVYPIKTVHSPYGRKQGILRSNVALRRLGTSTKEASPDEIVDWAKHDDPIPRAIQDAELQKLTAEAAIHATLVSTFRTLNGEAAVIGLEIQNLGHCAISIREARWVAAMRNDAVCMGDGGLAGTGYAPESGELDFPMRRVPSGEKRTTRFRWKRLEALAHIKQNAVEVQGWSGKSAQYDFRVLVESERGGQEWPHCVVNKEC